MLRALQHRHEDEAQVWLEAIRAAIEAGVSSPKQVTALDELVLKYHGACSLADAYRELRGALDRDYNRDE